jgi:hypothetical protein
MLPHLLKSPQELPLAIPGEDDPIVQPVCGRVDIIVGSVANFWRTVGDSALRPRLQPEMVVTRHQIRKIGAKGESRPLY